MPSPDASIGKSAPFGVLLAKELRDLASGRAFWILLILLSVLVGTSFDQAVALYAEASRAATHTPQLAVGLSPFDGIIAPTFGALYLAATFLLPFVAIRALAAEKQSGSLKLLLQLPYSQLAIIGAKIVALLAAWLAMAIIPASALAAWSMMGGHLAAGETANLLLGHFIYAAVIAGIALLCAALADSSASAAILALAATIGFWVLDFAAAGQGGAIQILAGASPTSMLRNFERGLLSIAPALSSLIAALGLVCLAGIWLHSGRVLSRKLLFSISIVACIGLAILATSQLRTHVDTTEDQRNSFPPAESAALKQLTQPLDMVVRLAPEDPRLIDFERGVLGKLRRTVPRLTVTIESDSRSGLYQEADEHYGEIVYRYSGREQISRSTGAGEVLPIIFGLSGVRPATVPQASSYPGYPLIADARGARIWFYGILPLLIIGAWIKATNRRVAALQGRARTQTHRHGSAS